MVHKATLRLVISISRPRRHIDMGGYAGTFGPAAMFLEGAFGYMPPQVCILYRLFPFLHGLFRRWMK